MLEDAPTVVVLKRNRHVRARKRHNCDHCHQPIPAGTKYFYSAYTIDGVFETTKSHSPSGECARMEED